MAPLKSQRHELFAQGLAAGKTQDQAYQDAGYKPSEAHASRLAGNGKVQARVAELQAANQEVLEKEFVLTKRWVLERLITNAKNGMKDGRPSSVANRALELVGKELGMFVERKEIGPAGAFDRMNTEDLRADIARRLGELGLGSDLAEWLPDQTH